MSFPVEIMRVISELGILPFLGLVLFAAIVIVLLLGMNPEARSKGLVYANLCFFGGLVLLVLWCLYLLFGIFFWTGMGFRDGPPPTSTAYWGLFLRVSGDVLASAATSFWFVTYPIVGAVAYGGYIRMKHRRKVA